MRLLITGGTGFLGSHLVKHYLTTGHEVVSFSRDEAKHEVQKRTTYGNLTGVIGDVRDYDRIKEALKGCDAVIHAAAQKHVPWSEEAPVECIKTNVQGTINVGRAAEECGVGKRLFVSTDKATKPINTYGATKFLAECVWRGPVVRLGNLFGSTGSVVFWLLSQRGRPTVEITSKRMVRYHLTASEAVKVCVNALQCSPGLYYPPMRWYRLSDLAEAVCPGQQLVETGVRKGEKLAEDLWEPEIGYSANERMTVEELRREVETLCGSMGMAVTPR